MRLSREVKLTLAQAFDEWMRHYRNSPESFVNTMQGIRAHASPREGGVSAYGLACAKLIEMLQEHGSEAWELVLRPEPPPKIRKKRRKR